MFRNDISIASKSGVYIYVYTYAFLFLLKVLTTEDVCYDACPPWVDTSSKNSPPFQAGEGVIVLQKAYFTPGG